jgi:glycosyltransferase involved in cell wall biosynthesis
MTSDLNILLFHDSFDSVGGAGRVAATIARAFDAQIASTNVDDAVLRDLGINRDAVHDLGTVAHGAPLGPIESSILFKKAHFSGFDTYIFSGNWAIYASYKHKPNVYYCHTPCREFYDLKSYALASQTNLPKKAIAWAWTTAHARFDGRAVQQVDQILANSVNVQDRIRRYYKRESEVVYPPIRTEKYRTKEFGDFWLSVNRLYPEKRVELQIETFRRLPDEQLLIVGGFSSRDVSLSRYHKIFDDMPRNVKILGWVQEDELLELYAKCRGVLFTALDEDFGMVAVEAQASGKAVVGVNEGGLQETVISGVTGFLKNPDPGSLAAAVSCVSKEPERYRDACIENARRFDEDIFVAKMRRYLCGE